MKDAIKMMENNMSPEAVRRAHLKAEQNIMSINFTQLKEEQNLKQSDSISRQLRNNHIFKIAATIDN